MATSIDFMFYKNWASVLILYFNIELLSNNFQFTQTLEKELIGTKEL